MTDTVIHCPKCSAQIPLTEALSAQIRAQLEARLNTEHQQQVRNAAEQAQRKAEESAGTQLAALRAELETHARRARAAEERELRLKRRALALEETQHTLAERIRIETEEKLRGENESRTLMLVQEATARTRGEVSLELKLANEQLAEERRKLTEAQQHELTLRQQAAALEQRTRSIDLELARKIDEQKSEWEAGLRQSLGEEQALKLREKEKQIGDLRRVIDDLQRKSQQGSQELQGEVLEIDIQSALEARFPRDTIRSVPKGMNGADLIQDVRDDTLASCGLIAWEMKNTKHWQPGWIEKLKDDQRACGASVGVIVSKVLPEEARCGFALVNGVWVVGLTAWPALAEVLRQQLIRVAFARNAATGMSDKMETLYQYLSGESFRHKVETIVEAFAAMRNQIDKERRAMTRHWAEREKQLERVILSTAGMYGDLRGTIGQAMQPIAALEFDDGYMLEEQTDDGV